MMTNILCILIIYYYLLYFSKLNNFNFLLDYIIYENCNFYKEPSLILVNENILSFSSSNNLLGKDKPKLSINTNPSSGNEGLDAEKE
jgi:hypothetical protein